MQGLVELYQITGDERYRTAFLNHWQSIRRFDRRTTSVIPNCDDSITKDLCLDHGWRKRGVDEEQLYDLVFDPNEAHNLAGSDQPQAKRALSDLRKRLKKWMRDTDDPLLAGPVPMPPGAILNDADGLSPQRPVLPGEQLWPKIQKITPPKPK